MKMPVHDMPWFTDSYDIPPIIAKLAPLCNAIPVFPEKALQRRVTSSSAGLLCFACYFVRASHSARIVRDCPYAMGATRMFL